MKNLIVIVTGAILIITFVVSGSIAAPFCAVFSYGKNCYYYSMNDCRSAVGSNGMCTINQEEVQAPSGGAPFCVVNSWGTQCWYYDAQSCRREAASSGGACVAK